MKRTRWPASGCTNRRLRGIRLGALLLLVLTLAAGAASATTVQGRISTTSYHFDPLATPGDPDRSTELDLINRLSLDIREIGTPSLSLYMFGVLRGEALVDGLDNSEGRLYRGHLRYSPSRRFALTVGRQWAYGGVGSAQFDGAQLMWRPSIGQLVLFGGSRGHLDPDRDAVDCLCDKGWDDSGIAGAFFRSREIADQLSLGASASRSMWNGETESERVGVLASWRPQARTVLFYEHRYETTQEKSYFQHLRLSRSLDHGGLAALTWNRREAYLPEFENSYIFQRFQDEPWFPEALDQRTDEIRGHLSLRPESLRGWRMNLELLEIFPEGRDRGDGAGISFDKGGVRFGYKARRGYRGKVDGFYGSLRHQLRERTRLWLDLNRVTYRFEYEGLPEIDPASRYTVASRLGLDHGLDNGFDFTVAGEVLDNRAAKYEVRFLARVVYRFRQASGSGEVK